MKEWMKRYFCLLIIQIPLFQRNPVLLGIVLDPIESFLNENVEDIHGIERGALEDKPPVFAVQLTRGVYIFETMVYRLHVTRVQAWNKYIWECLWPQKIIPRQEELWVLHQEKYLTIEMD